MSSLVRIALWIGILLFVAEAAHSQCQAPSRRPSPGAAPGTAPAPGITPSPVLGPGFGTTPGGNGAPRGVTPGSASWEIWWLNNADSYLATDRSWYRRVDVTTSADFTLGRAESVSTRDHGRAIREGGITPALLRCENDAYFAVREAAVLALAKVGGPRAFDAIVKHLSDDNPRVQAAAVAALGVLEDERGVGMLLDILKNRSRGKRLLAAAKIRPVLRAYATIGLGLGGNDSAVPALIEASRADEPRADIPVAATLALGLMPRPEVGDHLLALLGEKDRHPLVRTHAAVALGKILDHRATPYLLRALRDPSLQVSRSSVVALGLLGQSHTQPDATLVRALSRIVLRESDLQSRGWACIALGQIGGELASKTLLTTMHVERASLRAFAALGLGLHVRDVENPRTSEYLRAALARAKGQSLRGALVVALGLARDLASREMLTAIALSKAPSTMRGYAVLSLGMMKATASAPVLHRLLEENRKSPVLTETSALALSLMDDRGVIPLLIRILETSSTEVVRSSTAIALGRIGDATAIVPLRNLILRGRNNDQPSRAYAVTALGILGDRRPLPVFVPLRRNSNYGARVASMGALLSML